MHKIKLTIRTKLVLGFLSIALTVGIAGLVVTGSSGNMSKQLELSAAVDVVLLKSLDRESAVSEVINSSQLEEFAVLRQKVEALDMEVQTLSAELLRDFGIATVPELATFIEQESASSEIEMRILERHEELLTQRLVFAESYLAEKDQRYQVRTPIFESSDPHLIRDVGNLQYFSKEALYQYGDQQHVDEWLESINQVAQQVSAQQVGLSPESRQQVLGQLSAYRQTAQQMGRIVIRENEIRTEEAQLISDLKDLNSELEILRNLISGELNEIISTSFSNNRKLLMAAIMATFVLAIGAGLLISRSIAIPIRALTRMAEEISHGNLNVGLQQFTAKDEIGELASSFNRMSSQLKVAQSTLEQQVTDLEEAKNNLESEIAVRQRVEEGLERRAVELAAVNNELESFSYSVSHDLRAPLRSIDGFGQALLEDYSEYLDAQGKDYLQRMRGASQRMGESIDGLLNLSRVTRSEMSLEKVDLSTLAQAVTEELRATQPDRQVEFVVQRGLVANGDPQLLRAVLVNLLGNAWKFTRNRPLARIEFGLTQDEDTPAYFICDNGVGFDMAYVDKLFGAFQRLHAVTEFEGTGIGLATVERIIRRHGGHVWAEGAPDEGATFYFTLR